MNTLEAVAKQLYTEYVIENTDEMWTFPAWSLLPDHAKEKWYDTALLSGKVTVQEQ